MGTITPILDSLLTQVHGRRAALETFVARQGSAPLAPITVIKGLREGDDLQAQRPLTASAHVKGNADAGSATAAGARRAAASTQTRTGAQPQAAAPGASAASKSLDLSLEARLINALMAKDAGGAARALVSSAPLWQAAGAPSASALATALGAQIGQSGLFYESHLRQWLQGKRTLTQLRAEPQGNLAAGPVTARPASASNPTMPTAANAGGTGTAADAAMDRIVDAGSRGLVRHQLDTLAGSTVRWQGEAWPGTPMHCDIEPPDLKPDPEGAPETSAAAPASRLTTRIRLELPQLGDIEVQLSLTGPQLQLHAWAERDSARRALAPATAALRQRLTEAGFSAPHVELLAGDEP